MMVEGRNSAWNGARLVGSQHHPASSLLAGLVFVVVKSFKDTTVDAASATLRTVDGDKIVGTASVVET